MARSRRKSSATSPTARLRQRLLGGKRSLKPTNRRRRLSAELLEDRRLLATVAFSDDFESGSISSARWDAGIYLNSDEGGWAPSVQNENDTVEYFDAYATPYKAAGSYALNINGTTNYYAYPPREQTIATQSINLSAYDTAFVRYALQIGGNGDAPESTDSLRVFYRLSNGDFKLWRSESPNNYRSDRFYTKFLQLPREAIHANTAIAFSGDNLDGRYGFNRAPRQSDNWFVDTVRVVVNQPPTVSLTSSGETIDDSQLPGNFTWSAADPDGDSLTTTTFVRYAPNPDAGFESIFSSSAASGGFPLDGLTGLGTYQIDVTATDRSFAGPGLELNSESTTRSRTVTLEDDDVHEPTIVLSGSKHSESAAAPQHFTWSVDDASGSSSRVTVTRNGEDIFAREYASNVASDSFDFDSYGIGSYELTVEAMDLDDDRPGDALSATATRLVNVLNTPPAADLAILTPPQARIEGEPVQFSAAAASDADGDPLTYLWNFGDGTLVKGKNISHVFPDDGSFPVKLTVVDPFGGLDDVSQTVTVANQIPTVSVSATHPPLEAHPYSIDVTLVDPGNDATQATLHWGDGEQTSITESGTYSHFFTEGGISRDFRITLADEEGDYGEAYAETLTIGDAAPQISGLQDLLTAKPGETITLDVNVSDGIGDTLSYAWDFAGDSLTGDNLNHVSYAFPAAGLYTVRLSVTDSDGLTSEAFTTVAVGSPLSFSVDAQTVSEGAGSVAVTVNLDNGVAVGTDTEIPLLITGTATSDDFQIGTLLLPGNATTATTTVQLTDDLLSETTETIVLALGGVAGVSRGATAQQVIQIADNDAAPRVYFSTTGGTVAEGDEPVTLAATLSEPAGRDVRVPLAFSGSATRNEDFSTPSTPVLTIPAGSLSGTFELHVQDDSQREMAETIIVQMQSPEGAELSTLLGQSTRTVITIPQNDAPEISLDSAYRVTSEDISSLYLNARLSSLSEGPVSVPYTVRGTAIDGEDFNILSGSLLFLPGSLEASIRVNITDDIIDEDIEYFAIELEDPDNAALGVSRTVVTDILDNDISTLSFATATVRAFEDESPQNVTVNLSKPLSQPLMVPLLVSGTASEGNDYTLSSTSVLFNPGDVSKTVQINLLDDALHESTEHLYLRFGDIGSIRLGNQQQTSLVIQDEDPLIHLRQVSYAARETDTQYQVFASLSAPSNEDVVVPLLYRGNATRGADYQGPSSIVIPAGETSANGSITIIDDELFEGDEQVRVYAQAASSGEYVGNTVLSTTIRDDDEPQRVFWSLANQTVAEDINYTTLQVELTRAAPQPVTVAVEYDNDSARRQADYLPATFSVTIPAGETKAPLDIVIVDDDNSESMERFRIKLANPQNALLPADPQLHYATINITDNEILSVAQSREVRSNINRYISEAAIDSGQEIIDSISVGLANNEGNIGARSNFTDTETT